MAITKQLRDEADRAIEGIRKYYDGGDALCEIEEREHRIGRIEAALDGCNGYTEKEKIQKTAETVFKLTCASEYNSLKLDKMNSKLDSLISSSKNDSKPKQSTPDASNKDEGSIKFKVVSVIDRHFLAVSILLIILLSLAFVSGHPDWFTSLLGK